MEVIFLDEARRELQEETAWPQEHSTLGGAAFVELIRKTTERISRVPLASPCWPGLPRVRTWTLQRVKFRVVYVIGQQAIYIVAIAHTSRDPGYWLRRLP